MIKGKIHIFVLLTFLLGLFPQYLHATQPSIKEGSMIVDDEISNYLQEILENIFKTMGIPLRPRVLLIYSPDINAAATFGGIIFVYTGLIYHCEHAGQLIAVLAHEAGHVKGTHLMRMGVAAEQNFIPSILSTLIGGAAAIATGNPAPLMAGAMGSMHVFDRAMKKHSQGEEENADSSAASVLGKNTTWAVEILEKIDRKSFSKAGSVYDSTHPLTPKRIADNKDHAQRYKDVPTKFAFPDDYEQRFKFIHAKVAAFQAGSQAIVTPKEDWERYQKVIQLNVKSNASPDEKKRRDENARTLLQELIQKYIQNKHLIPYFYELSAQMYMERGDLKNAIVEFEKALAVRNTGLRNIRVMLAHLLIESDPVTAANMSKSTALLTTALEENREDPFVLRLLARAYGKDQKLPEAAACLAKEALLTGQTKMAEQKAKDGLKSTNPQLAQQSRDIINEINGGKKK